MNHFLSPDPSFLHPLPPPKHENDKQNKSLDFLISKFDLVDTKRLKTDVYVAFNYLTERKNFI